MNPDTVAGVICGAFLGPGSEAMVALLTNGTCMPFLGWNLYVLKDGSWQDVQLPGHGGFTAVPVTAVGNDLRETLPIRQAGDTLCNDDHGTETRGWHWNGSALVPGAWTYKRKGGGTPTTPSREHYYTSPTGNIICGITAAAGVYCQTFTPPQHASLRPNGKLDLCRGNACAGNPGENSLYSKVPYGKSVTAGRFRCSSAFTGITCVNTQTGKGFLIARAGIKRVG